MPGFGPALGDDEIASILSYVRSAWTDAPADVTSAFVKKIRGAEKGKTGPYEACLLYTSPSPRDNRVSRMPSSA